MAALGFHCCVWALSSCGKWELLFVVVQSFSLQWFLLLWSTGSRYMGLVAPQHVESSQARDWTHFLCIGRRIPILWTPRDVLIYYFLLWSPSVFSVTLRWVMTSCWTWWGHNFYHQGRSSTFCTCQANEEAVAERIDEFIAKLKELKQVASPFTLVSIEGLQVP